MTVSAPHEIADLDAVRAGFAAFAAGDLAAFAAGFADGATWNHRNQDRFGGVHRGRDAILAFVRESGRLTEGTLRAIPERYLGDGRGSVAVTVRVSGRRPDGRTFEDEQVLLYRLEGGQVRAVDQYVGDPGAATAFWA